MAEPSEIARASEEHLRRLIRDALRVGSLLGAGLLLVGLLLTAHEGAPVAAVSGTRLSLDALGNAFLRPSGPGFLLVGVAVLALTPLSRVVLAVSIFARARDRPLLALTMFVLLALVATVVVGVFV